MPEPQIVLSNSSAHKKILTVNYCACKIISGEPANYRRKCHQCNFVYYYHGQLKKFLINKVTLMFLLI